VVIAARSARPRLNDDYSSTDVAAFKAALQSSQLCQPEVWPALNVNDLLLLYNSSVTAALDRTIPLRTVRCRRRPSDPWFDEDSRLAKRLVCRMEREAQLSCSHGSLENSVPNLP